MGLRPAKLIERAAAYLLSQLDVAGTIEFSAFYDESEETNRRLCAGIGISQEEGEWYSAEALMDNAIAQLEQQGVVRTQVLENLLPDDEPNYRISLTDAGRAKLRRGIRFSFFDSE